LGETSVYAATNTGFDIYLHSAGLTPANAAANGWRINWLGAGIPSGTTQNCGGYTQLGATNWVQHATNVIYTDVDTTGCHFKTIPKYFTVLAGDSSHWVASGMTAIYSPQRQSFRVYVKRVGATPSYANQRNWQIRWTGVP
jgi:hypothetical protein